MFKGNNLGYELATRVILSRGVNASKIVATSVRFTPRGYSLSSFGVLARVANMAISVKEVMRQASRAPTHEDHVVRGCENRAPGA